MRPGVQGSLTTTDKEMLDGSKTRAKANLSSLVDGFNRVVARIADVGLWNR